MSDKPPFGFRQDKEPASPEADEADQEKKEVSCTNLVTSMTWKPTQRVAASPN